MTMSTIVAVEIPKWGMTMEEGSVTEWLVAVGDTVAEGTALATVESSKISAEVEAPTAGVVRRLVAALNESLPVGEVIAVIADAAATDADIDAYLATRTPAGAAAEAPATAPAAAGTRDAGAPAPPESAEPPDVLAAPSAKPAPAAVPGEVPTSSGAPAAVAAPAPASGATRIPSALQGADETEVPATSHARRLATEYRIALSGITPTGRGGQVTVRDIEQAVRSAGGQLGFGNDRVRVPRLPDRRDDSEVLATPHARRLATEHGINLRQCRVSGRGGRVLVDDVLAVMARRSIGTEPPPAAPAAAGPAAPVAGSGQVGNEPTTVAMSSMRRVIADRLRSSYLDSPHFRVTAHADIGRLLELRTEINDSRLDARVTVNDLLVAAAAKALVAVPGVNAQYDPGRQEITQFAHADIAVAVSTGQGLITPIVSRADTRSITDISAQITDLATRAKAGTLRPDEFQGGTFTISNLGMFGVSGFDAIINPPQVAILAVGATQSTFVPGDDSAPVVASLLPLTLASDHRVVDGALAARFLQHLCRVLQTPSLMFA